MTLWKAFLVAAMGWGLCFGVEAQIDHRSASPVGLQTSSAAGLRDAKVGIGVLYGGDVYVTVEGRLVLIIPVEDLDFQSVHGKVVSFFVSEDSVAYIIIVDTKIG